MSFCAAPHAHVESMPLSKLTTIIFVFWLSLLLCQAQLSQIDSLNQHLSIAEEASDSLVILIELSRHYVDVNVEQGALITKIALKVSQSQPNDSLEVDLLLGHANYAMLSSDFEQSESVLRDLLSGEIDSYLRAEAFYQMGKTLQLAGKHDSAIVYFDKTIELSRDLGRPLTMELGRAYKSESLNRLGKLQEALDLCTQSLTQIRKTQAKKEEAIVLNFLGGINVSLGSMPTATRQYLEALTIADSLQNERLKMEQLNDIGVIYAVQGESEESIVFFERALKAAERIRSHRDYIGTLSNLAYMHSVTNNYDQSIAYYNVALNYNDQYGEQCLHPFIHDGLARLYERLSQPDSVKKYFEQVLIEARNCQLKEFEISALQGMGRYYKGRSLIKQSIDQFLTSFEIAQENNFKPLMQISAAELYQTFKQEGDYSMALKYHEIAEALEDSIYNEQNKDEILRLTAKYEFETEKHKIEVEQERQQIQYEAELQSQLLTRNYMIIGLILTVILIFTLWRSYELKRRSNTVLARLNHEKNELIGVVAHDLRNPLNSILGFSQMLIEDLKEKSGSQHQFLSRINSSAARMEYMIERVLDVNAIESEKMNLDIRSVDMAVLLDSVVENLRPAAESKYITVESHYARGVFFAEIDENYGIQIFENLISNAIKFSESNKTVGITIMHAVDRIKILVVDNGPGIDEEDIKLLFQRFTKLTARPTANETSTGLGLSIVKKYVNAMGGDIDVKSVKGVGSTFIVSFWRSKEVEERSLSVDID